MDRTQKFQAVKYVKRFSQNILESNVLQKEALCVWKSLRDLLRRQRYLKDLISRIRENCAQFTTVAPCSGMQYAGHWYTLSSTERNWTNARVCPMAIVIVHALSQFKIIRDVLLNATGLDCSHTQHLSSPSSLKSDSKSSSESDTTIVLQPDVPGFSQNILESNVLQKEALCVWKSLRDLLRRQRYLKDLISRIRENCAQFTTVAPCSGTQYAGHCYTLSSTERNWTNARDDCQSRGGYLVDITSSAENNIAKQLAFMSPSDQVWLGATDELEEGVYRWVSNNQTMTFTDWYRNDPDGGNGQNCLSTYLESRLWIDNICSSSLPYICET
ncbi:hypothetical protein KUTeg_009421 [Tegillarca granosa]|uniref:C-type lectin domain-containing protein n=1 Tax=Tegillarca granosa TaxID=220873 RepID=A0ABQ9F3U3_TEGGR|nr:hypothetical protein KUTeg_009421 [Tegillarca granosa]